MAIDLALPRKRLVVGSDPDVGAPQYGGAISGDAPDPQYSEAFSAIHGAPQMQSVSRPNIDITANLASPQSLRQDDLRQALANPPQFQRQPIGTGQRIANQFFGRFTAPIDQQNGVQNYKDALQNYQTKLQGLQGQNNLDVQQAATQRQSSLDALNRENIQSEIDTRQRKPEPQPKTVDTGSGIYQFNEDTNRYDIRVADSKKPPAVPGRDIPFPADVEAQRLRDKTQPQGPKQLVSVPNDDGSSSIIEAKPGMTLPRGAHTISQGGQINQMEQTRADMAENVNENLNQLEEIVNRRPDLFGPLSGRLTKGKELIGTSDPDIAQMKQTEDNLGRALTSAHGMRNGKLVEDAVNGVLNGYKNGAGAIKAAIGSARNSVKTFQGDVTRRGGGAGPTSGNEIHYKVVGGKLVPQ